METKSVNEKKYVKINLLMFGFEKSKYTIPETLFC